MAKHGHELVVDFVAGWCMVWFRHWMFQGLGFTFSLGLVSIGCGLVWFKVWVLGL